MQLAVDSFLYVVNIRPAYRWAAFGDCIAFVYTLSAKPEQRVTFWNIKTDEK